MVMIFRQLIIYFLVLLIFSSLAFAEIVTPIVFVTQVPKPDDFANIVSTFANQKADPQSAPRGGDLWIRYPDGTLKNLTREAGYGEEGLQGENSITVRDPVVHWDGNKVLFSMVVGAPKQYEVTNYRFQLYEVVGIGRLESPRITRVAGQPRDYNNVMPAYTADDKIIFSSDMPRGKEAHLYPQLDEYESTPTNTGLWLLDPSTRNVRILDHSPSGDFHPMVDSFGRVLFIRWDHLQQDQQAEDESFGAFTYSDEGAGARRIQSRKEVFPEPRSEARRERPGVALHTFNIFIPWMMNPDGTELETLNHIGRHELRDYFQQNFLRDSSLEEFIASISRVSENSYSIENLFQIRESLHSPGTYYLINGQEFHTHASGQIVTINGAPSDNPDDMVVESVTHPSTSNASQNAGSAHTGLYRNPLPLQNGSLVAAHTDETRIDLNIGSRANPRSRYNYRLKEIVSSGRYSKAGSPLTSGIRADVSYYDPDVLVSYDGELWELQPVEVVARSRPPLLQASLPQVEESTFREASVSVEDFRNYLYERNLSLIVSRDVSTRDRGDKQQPFQLSVKQNRGGHSRVDGIQFYQGDQIRGYSNFVNGRRVMAKKLHAVSVPNAMVMQDLPGAYQLADDGSYAALVPAGRALSWELIDSAGNAVVRERFWVTFQPGEIRVCASCHGINKRDQDGNRPPKNSPAALIQLLQIWKEDPNLVLVPENPGGGSESGEPRLRLSRKSVDGKVSIIVKISQLDSREEGISFELTNKRGRVLRRRSFSANAKGKKRLKFVLPRRRVKSTIQGTLYRGSLPVVIGELKRIR